MGKNRNRNKTQEQKIEQTLIDVVVPVYGNFQTAMQCLNSLPNAMKKPNGMIIPYKVYLVDDASKDQQTADSFYAAVNDLPQIAHIQRRKQNYGFGRTVNDAAMFGHSKFILVLSTDVIYPPESIHHLLVQLEANDDVGITFPKLLFFPNTNDSDRPAGTIQSAGMVFDVSRRPVHIFLGWHKDHPFANRVRDMNACTGATFLIRRNIFTQLRGFDPVYGSGTFEDLDLCFRVRLLKYLIRYIPQTVAFHYVGQSAIEAKIPFPLERNYNIWAAKFSETIPYDEWVFSGII